MNPQDVTFLRRLIGDQATERRRGSAADKMASLEGIGRVMGAKVVYTATDHLKAINLLKSRGFDLQQPAEPFTRSEAPRGGSEKTGALRVSEDLVAVAGIHLPEIAVPTGAFVAIPGTRALELPYEVLMVVENLTPLQRLHEYDWLSAFVRGRKVLALFRGAPGWFRTDAAAQVLRTDTRPTLAFFDFDPKGLSMALAVPRREALCLPPWEQLHQAVKRENRIQLFTNSVHQCRTQLDASADQQVTAAWARMKELAVGLDQEHFPTRC